ncbi:hypothetical protein ACV07N_06955 [Roseivirga echinicomitans]
MSFFDDIYNKIFKGKNNGPSELIHEMLERTNRETQSLQSWMDSTHKKELLNEIYNAYHLKKKGIATKLDVHFLDTKYSNGFAVTYDSEISPDDFRNLFDYLKEKTLEFDYKLMQNDRRIIDRELFEETIEKWYLKPQADALEENITNQLYGNILIEYVLIDRKPSYIKLMANIYQDRLYSQALPFEVFFEKLFDRDL